MCVCVCVCLTVLSFLCVQVGRLAEECPHLRLRVDTLTKTLNACELDSRASRETILRLVSEVKKHEKLALELSELQQVYHTLCVLH